MLKVHLKKILTGIGKIRREQMARTSWKCPYPNCKQESSRNWNLQRHILRAHNAVGNPVKDKSFARGVHVDVVQEYQVFFLS
jgi:hypothetical protein